MLGLFLACDPLQKKQCVAGAPSHVSDVYELLVFHQRDISPLNFSDESSLVMVPVPERVIIPHLT